LSELNVSSPTYYRDCKTPNYYYQALQINVSTTGSYILWSASTINTYGYIYKDEFDQFKPFENLLLQNSGNCNHGQFKLMIDLQANTKYILVVTTYHPNITGHFSIVVSGLNNISLNHLSKNRNYCVLDKFKSKEHGKSY
jgi:hypothetical protein